MNNTSYIEYRFTVNPKEPGTEILIAELSNAGFESFVENENGVTAYIKKEDHNITILDDIYILSSGEFLIKYSQKELEKTNWNKEWEKNFLPIQVDDLVSIRASFHKNPNLEYDIIIDPKMSFGTGHHETTYMMIQHLLELDLENKLVLDMGCGTGILAIFSEMKGAKHIDAIDIDNWCYLNSIENTNKNRCRNVTVCKGDASILKNQKYDVIIANINRNILLNDLKAYVSCLNEKGIVLLSGFYKKDIPIIESEAAKYDLILGKIIERNNWVATKFLKKK